MRSASRNSFSERLRSPFARASQPSFSSEAASTGSRPSSSAVSRTSSIIVCAASSSPFTLKNPAYASVTLIRARTLPLSPASSRARVSRISASSSSSRDDVGGRERLRRDRLEILPPGVERLHVRALHEAHVVLARAEPGTDDRAGGQRVEVGDGIGVAGQELEGLIDERSRAGRVTVSLERGLTERRESKRLVDSIALLARPIPNLGHLDLHRAPVLEPPGGTRREVASTERRAKLEGAQSERARIRVRLACDRALRRLHERRRGLLSELLGRGAFELGQELDGLVEVVRTNLHELLARSLGEPLGEARVVLRPRELGHPRVCDLADQCVLEPVCGLARDR